MKIVAGYLLLVLGGNATPSAAELKSLLSSGMPSSLSFEEIGRPIDLSLSFFPEFFVVDVRVFLSCLVGAEAADEMIDLFLSNVSGKDITELIALGREKLASVPSGGGGGGGVALTAAAVAAASYDAAPADAPAEAKKEEIAEEEDDVSFL